MLFVAGLERVRIVRGPVADPDFGVLFDHALEANGLACRRVEERLSLISRRPLRSRDEILSPGLRTVSAAASRHEPIDKRLLLVWWDRFHGQNL